VTDAHTDEDTGDEVGVTVVAGGATEKGSEKTTESPRTAGRPDGGRIQGTTRLSIDDGTALGPLPSVSRRRRAAAS